MPVFPRPEVPENEPMLDFGISDVPDDAPAPVEPEAVLPVQPEAEASIDSGTAGVDTNTSPNHNQQSSQDDSSDTVDRFLRILCGVSAVTFQVYSARDDMKKKTKSGKMYDPNAKVLHGDTPENRKVLAKFNSKCIDIFVMVNEGDGIVHAAEPGKKKPTTCRNGHNVIRIRAFFLDLDGSPLQPVLDAGLTPHIIIESSPGRFHCYWLVADATLEQFTPMQRAIAARFKGDISVNDLPRVMRVPGFMHQKGEPFLSRILEIHDDLPKYSVQEVIDGLGLDPHLNVSKEKSNKSKSKKSDDSYMCGASEGGRTNNITKVARSQSKRGFSEEETIAFCLTHDSMNNVPPLEQTHPGKVAAIVQDVYKRYVQFDADETPDYVAELNLENFVSRDGSKTVVCRESRNIALNRSELIRSSFTDFKNYHNNRCVMTGKDKNGEPEYTPLGSAWLAHLNRRQYSEIIMSPGGDVEGKYNLWRGYAVKAIKGSWQRMQDHIFHIICDRNHEVYTYLIGWMARMIQQPGKQGEVAIVLQGGRGTGKGMFGNDLCRIMGQHACHVTNGQHVTGNFNAHLEDCILLFADEAFWAGDKQAENVLKGLITEPTIPIERKGVDLKTVQNMLHVLMASNNDWVVPAGMDERRYCVLKVSDRFAQNHQYFEDLVHEMDNGGLEAMLYDLQHANISTFNVRAVPNTTGLMEQKIQSLDPVMNWWFQKLQDGELIHDHEWGDVPFPSLYDDYIASVQKLGGNVRRANETSFAMLLRKTLPKPWPKDSRRVPKDAPGWNQKRVKHYEFPGLDICRKQFEILVGDKLEWPEVSPP
ncbi:MAG: DUF5906 domain-containing protein [Desulfuromonadales bacterium]